MSELVLTSREAEIGIVTVNNPPVNALSPGVPEGVVEAVRRFEKEDGVRAIVLIGGGRTFIAGADIREFDKLRAGERTAAGSLGEMLLPVENCTKPVIAAIHGTALGGGLETAMACHYRVAVATAQVGQPEVKLGIIPGAGGTQRLPRLAGIARAAEMCASGEPVRAAEAQKAGIVDRVVEGDLLAGAIAFAREGRPVRRTRDLAVAPDDAAIAAAREAAKKRHRGLMAPLKAIEAVEAAARLSFEEGCAYEGRLFRECIESEQSRGMIHVFFGERTVAKIPDIPPETPVLPVRRVGVVGAGTMGGGIAMVFANAGIPVLLKEATPEALERGLATITRNYANSVKRGRFPQEAMDQRLALIRPSVTYDGFEDVDMVVEAVFEGMELKKRVFGELDGIARRDAILATNTSTLNIDEIASATSRPLMVLGTHFFSPANVMRLLEVVRGRATSREVIATVMQLSKKLGKVGVLVGNCRGFVGNRMFGPYRREAQFLVEEGASIEAVDGALYEFGMAMGPLAVGDLAGLDVGWRIRQEYRRLEPPGVRQPFAEDRLCEMGRYGQKTGAGWYRYDESRRATADPEVEALVRKWAREAGIPQRRIEPQEIVERLIYALVNEGANILEGGYALRPVDIDIVYVTGYGFPVYRGGPMFYADTVGLEKVYQRVCELEGRHGYWWRPAPLLKRLAEAGGKFSEFGRGR